jgi:hypothetical protein
VANQEHKRHGIERSSEWPKIEKSFLLHNPYCVACKTTHFHCQVHHVFPFHYCILLGRPDLELDPRNLITLCETTHFVAADNHHILLGHCDDFRSGNLRVREDVKTFYGMNLHSIKLDQRWQDRCKEKLKPWDEMSDQDKQEFKELMDKTYA